MKTHFSARLLLAALLALAAPAVCADEEQDLIALLQSTATPTQKSTACQRLRMIGTPKAVPALAALLLEERTGHAARHALEGLPFPEAGAALRAALGKAAGLTQAGLIDSLGWRRELEAAPSLAPLLSATDPLIASAAAAALGKIGGQEAISALSAARDQASPTVRPAVLEGLLQCAERLLAAGDGPGATVLYRGLFEAQAPVQVRAAAWRGMALSAPGQRAELVRQALVGNDRQLQAGALKLLRELNDLSVVQACLRDWATLAAEAQLAVLEAHLRSGAEALPTVRAALESRHSVVRVAALGAVADLGAPALVPTLAKAAASGEPAERDAARESLARVRGPGMREGLLALLASAEPAPKAEVLRALGERGDRGAANLLLQNASAESGPARVAALESLRQLALPETLSPLLDLAAKSKSEAQLDPVLKALDAVCQASPDKGQTGRQVIETMSRLAAAERRQVLPLLAELGTPEALTAAQAAAGDKDPELAKAAVGVLAQWPNAAPALRLLELARTSGDPALQTLALRGAIEVTGQEPDLGQRFRLLQSARATARRADEKKQVLGQLGQIPTREALALTLQDLADAGLVNEAGLAAVSIAEKLAAADPKLAEEAAVQVLAQCQAADVVKRAWALRKRPAAGGPFLRDWVVCGPFSQPGVAGALALFPIPFGPEKPGEKVQWKAVPSADSVNLSGLFPDQANCVAYLRTQLIAPQDVDGVLLMGSDDGLLVWLNGAVAHSHNVDRGQVVDQDAAPIHLKRGANSLLVKVTQGGGGWSLCARIVGADGQPIAGLRVEPPPPDAPPLALPAPPPPPAPKPATLPPRDTYQKLRLADQFYAEGAYYGDFNRDGKLDIVAGPFWFEGPRFQQRHEYRPAKTFDPKDYSDNFLTFTGDFNGDGWVDVLGAPFPGKECYWYENPAGAPGPWKRRLAYPMVGNESPMWGDVNGDGRPELLFCNEGFLGYAGPDLAKPDAPWVFHAVSTQDKRFQQFTHGVGFGDLNGDGRVDLVEATGWWEQPADLKSGLPWAFHSFPFAEAAAQMLVTDVDGDGLADVITAWHCHQYGMVWWQQIRNSSGQPDWRKHIILSPTPDLSTADFRPSQLHALDLVDMNGDGVKDVLTGKRFWSHGPTGDKEPDAPAVVFWLELRRGGQGNVNFVPHLVDDDSGVGTQVATADLNADGRPDVIVGNKKGIFVHLSQGATK